MKKTAVLYGSSTGTTKGIAKTIASKLNADIFDISDWKNIDFSAYQGLVLGTSTWGAGDLQDDWDSVLPRFAQIGLKGKHIALFGLGDSASYPDTFVDGMGAIYKAIKDKGCIVVGACKPDGYDFSESAALADGQFVGLPLDEDNESALSEGRIAEWIEKIGPYFVAE